MTLVKPTAHEGRAGEGSMACEGLVLLLALFLLSAACGELRLHRARWRPRAPPRGRCLPPRTRHRGGYTALRRRAQSRRRAWPTAGLPSIRFIPVAYSPGDGTRACVVGGPASGTEGSAIAGGRVQPSPRDSAHGSRGHRPPPACPGLCGAGINPHQDGVACTVCLD